ncbi:MAG TPA: glycosyltransferase family 2 protein [Acidimicrobiia bacterium]|nr:glycosyltransferase family 2 protein [Acidimicrobiia bacterium]
MDPRLLALGVAWLLGWCLCSRVRLVPYAPDPDPGVPSPSVVIPARDEEQTLPTILAGLASQTTPPREVIVVDDGSVDTTAAVAAARGARVIRGEPVPAGWVGKAWALQQGVAAARGDPVVCLDADVDPSSHLIARLGQCHAERGGLVSVQPYHEMRRWWERAAAFFNLVAVMGVGIGSPLPSRARERSAFGPCLIARRDALLTHLGHRSVRRAVIEDVALARRFAAANEPVTSFAGGDLLAFRMYDRPGRLIEGFAKNFAAGAASTPVPRLVAIVVWIAACLVAGWGLLAGGAVAIALYAAFALQCFVLLRQLGSFGIVTALLFPLNAVIFVAVFLWSLVLLARGQVRWKGRRVSTRRRSTEGDP